MISVQIHNEPDCCGVVHIIVIRIIKNSQISEFEIFNVFGMTVFELKSRKKKSKYLMVKNAFLPSNF